MSQLYIEFFYRHTIAEMLSWGLALVLTWGLLASLAGKSECGGAVWRNLNRVLFVAVVCFTLYWTLLKRTEGERGVSLIPLYSFIAARTSSERYRSLVANILLFIPFGLSLPFAFRIRRPILTTVVSAVAFSLVIELSQFIFALGLCETDDVIANTLGCAVGALPYFFDRALRAGKKMRSVQPDAARQI